MSLSTVRYLRFLQFVPVGRLAPCVAANAVHLELVRRHSKHWNPKFKWLRKKKVIKVDLPDFEDKRDAADLTQEEVRAKMKEKGLQPPRPWMERPFYISCTGGIFEPYVPPEGDGKISPITMHGAKQKVEFLEKKSKSMLAVRKIRSFEEDFDAREFVQEAQDIYIKAHDLMASKDENKIQEYVTERAYPEIRHNTIDKTIRWKFIKSLEPPRLVHARCTDLITKDNIFGQVTVRFHTQQVLAIYDRFGRLMHGSEILAKDVLEYVVFEKHLSNEYGLWRLHEKIVPDWMPPKEPVTKTYRVEPVKETKETKEVTELQKTPSEPEVTGTQGQQFASA
ncbi:large ribosomal subunit protein mL45 [Periplaneta americana]|uniref:large ribosomal subunit protein mL45 n=1 Tax=Periplaneta americana TaxID=6978 RepID=UPI0037E819FA